MYWEYIRRVVGTICPSYKTNGQLLQVGVMHDDVMRITL